MPMSARVSAGASLMPSPTMATLPRVCKPAHGLLLVAGQQLRHDLVNTRLAADSGGGAAVVAGEHDYLHAHILELL